MIRPRIKYEHRPVRFGEDLVQIGGSVPGIAATIPDPDGAVWALVILLDGTRTVDQVVADLVHHHPDHPPEEVHQAIGTLRDAGYLEDAAMADGLTAELRERYGRSRALWQWMDLVPRTTGWHAQLALRQARVTVVGIGGVGSSTALALVQSGVGQVHMVDHDVVELSNLNRQALYTEHDLGHPKIDAARRRLASHNSDVVITGDQIAVDGPGALRRLAIGCDVLVMAADVPQEIRSWTNRACLDTGTAWVHGGYRGPRINIGIFRPGTGPCYDCARLATAERQAACPPITLWPVPADTPVTQAANAVSAGMAGHLAAHAAMSLITGVPRLPINREFGFNLVTLQDSAVPELRQARPDCPACGPAAV